MNNNLRDQNGCHNCRFVFVYREYDEGDTYFCDLDGTRPTCPSVLMDECPSITQCREEWRRVDRQWDEWAGFGVHGRKRGGWEMCDEWKKRQD